MRRCSQLRTYSISCDDGYESEIENSFIPSVTIKKRSGNSSIDIIKTLSSEIILGSNEYISLNIDNNDWKDNLVIDNNDISTAKSFTISTNTNGKPGLVYSSRWVGSQEGSGFWLSVEKESNDEQRINNGNYVLRMYTAVPSHTGGTGGTLGNPTIEGTTPLLTDKFYEITTVFNKSENGNLASVSIYINGVIELFNIIPDREHPNRELYPQSGVLDKAYFSGWGSHIQNKYGGITVFSFGGGVNENSYSWCGKSWF